MLSDNPASLAADLSPEQLKERLTERYFQDYASAWLDFLNRLDWQPAGSLDQVIDQLTLMSDVRQSPLIALMNTLAYQGQAGTRGPALGASLIHSAQKLMTRDKVPLIDQQVRGASGPLDATFGPLLALLGKEAEGKNDNDRLSLQAFLTQVTRVRLKLQQVSSAADPQEMTQALAQTVFQGKSVDLTDTRAYGSLIAASLGAEWGGSARPCSCSRWNRPGKGCCSRRRQASIASGNGRSSATGTARLPGVTRSWRPPAMRHCRCWGK